MSQRTSSEELTMRTRSFLLLMTVALIAAACGGGSGTATTTGAGADTTSAATESTASAAETTVGETATTAAETDTTAGATGEAIGFGMLIGVTGDYAPYYDVSVAGAEIAIEEINAEGGVLGQPVELVVQDNLSTVEGAVQGYSALSDVAGVIAIGGVESDGALAIYDSIHEAQIPTICPACGTSELDEAGGEFIFRITGSDSDGGLIAAQFARDSGAENVGMLVQNTEGASAPAEVFKTVFEDNVGGTVSADVRFDPGKTSYQAEVDQAFAAEPDAVYVGSGFEAGGIILQEWQRRGYGGQFFFSPDMIVPEIAALTEQGVEIGDGVARAAIPAYDISTPAYESYAERFEAKTGEAPSPGLYDANQYDQYVLLALAITAAGSTEGPAVAAAIPEVANPDGTVVYSYADGVAELEAGNDIDYHGASSSLDFNEFGNLASPVFGEQAIVDGAWAQQREVELDASLRP
jgi:branched-chain amino acid transport system substrate-binding protein